MTRTSPKHIIVIGGGLAGLSASFDLSQAGHQVTILENAPSFGGLASSLTIQGQHIERFYHFICQADRDLIHLIEELGLSSQLYWTPTKTSFFYNGRLYPFGTPFDLVRFSPVPWVQRFRFGFHILRSRYQKHWRALDKIPAKAWLIRQIGSQAYNVIWHPLLKVKFGHFHDQISAAWVWHRIWRVATSRQRIWQRERFGYLENGSSTIIEALLQKLRRQPGVSLCSGVRVQDITIGPKGVTGVQVDGHAITCDGVISTVPLPTLERMLPHPNGAFGQTLRQIEYIGVVCMLMSLKHPFSDSFWMNIHDERISFNGIIEQTNLNHNLKTHDLNILYIPFYLPVSEPRYQDPDTKLFAEYVAALSTINPHFSEDWIREWHVFRAKHAQAICTINFADRVPAHRTPIKGLYITDSTQFYPEDRTISAAIRQGRQVAKMIQEQDYGDHLRPL